MAQDQGFGRAWSPMLEILAAKPESATAEWDLVPQIQISLSKLQHVLVNVGVRVPLNERERESRRSWCICCGTGSTAGYLTSEVDGRDPNDDDSSPDATGRHPMDAGRVADSTSRRTGHGRDQRSVARTKHLDVSLFAHSDECMACHNNLLTPSGEDVSIGATWRATMMANSARDPCWQAAVRRETIDHPMHSADIQDECAECHMPMSTQIARAAGRKGEMFAHLPLNQRIGRRCVGSLRMACRAPSVIRSRPIGWARVRASTASS